MNTIAISDAALKAACASVRQSMLSSLPALEECEQPFSDRFLQGMRPLLSKAHRRAVVRRTFRDVAACFLAVLFILGVWLTVDIDARAAALRWLREVYENSVVYRFFDHAPDTSADAADFILPEYRPSWLPDGCELMDEYTDDTLYGAYYYNSATGEGVVFQYFPINDAYQIELIDSQYQGLALETVSVNGKAAHYYPPSDESESGNLILIDDTCGYVFSLNSNLEKNVILHIAENIILCNPTK